MMLQTTMMMMMIDMFADTPLQRTDEVDMFHDVIHATFKLQGTGGSTGARRDL